MNNSIIERKNDPNKYKKNYNRLFSYRSHKPGQ